MDYRRFGDTIIARIDKGEEIVAQVRRIAEAEQIKLASVEALGALSEFNVGLFDVVEKKFHGNHFEGAYEVVSLFFLWSLSRERSTRRTASSTHTFI